MPTDPQLMNYDETELLTIHNDIEKVIENSEYDEIVFGADFNWDRTRNSGFAACMERWIVRVGLADVWDSYPVSYTHIHTDLKSVSTLDRFLVSPGLLEHIVDAGVLHLGDNPSRHSPIMLKLQIDGISQKLQQVLNLAAQLGIRLMSRMWTPTLVY